MCAPTCNLLLPQAALLLPDSNYILIMLKNMYVLLHTLQYKNLRVGCYLATTVSVMLLVALVVVAFSSIAINCSVSCSDN
jgi:hypothetical protein